MVSVRVSVRPVSYWLELKNDAHGTKRRVVPEDVCVCLSLMNEGIKE